MRRILGALGYVLGPLVGSGYFVFLLVANLDGRWQAVREDSTNGLLLRGARGLPRNAGAITFGKHVFSRRLLPSSALVRHELTHVRQYRQYGWVGFLARYGRQQGLVGYRRNALEQEARNVAGV